MLTKLGWNVEWLVKISLCVEEGNDRVEFEYLYCGGVIGSVCVCACKIYKGRNILHRNKIPFDDTFKFLDHLTTTN